MLMLFVPFAPLVIVLTLIFFFSKKKYCIVGPKASGKTTLAYLMEKGELIDTHISTGEREQISNACIDLPGSDAFIREWEKDVKRQEYTLYVFNLEKYADNIKYEGGTYQNVVLYQLDMILDWTTNSKLIVIGTHLDKIGSEKAHMIAIDIKNKLSERQRYDVKIVKGSLKDKKSAESLLKAIKQCME